MFVYVLHFDTPIEHAQHYVGSTCNIVARLKAHATGQGARLTAVTIEKEIEWQLAALFQTTAANGRRIEKALKEQANAPQFCEVCNEHPRNLPGAQRYPFQNVLENTRSNEIKNEQFHDIEIHYATCDDDEEFALSLMKIDRHLLGFIPPKGLTYARMNRRMIICKNNDDRVGYLLFTENQKRTEIKIQQCCVRDDARMVQHGRMMIDALQATHPKQSIHAKVREDLPANFFWEAIGFQKLRKITHQTSGSKLNQYYHQPRMS